MAKINPACEHCGHEFDPHKTVKGPVICPACGLTAHPFGVATPATAVSAPPGPSNQPNQPPHRMQPVIISVLVLVCVVFISVLFFNLILLKRINLIQSDQARIFAMLAELQVDVQPPAAAPAEFNTEEIIQKDAATAVETQDSSAHNTDRNPQFIQLEKRLERNYPLIPANSEVKLRQNNGQILRGTYIGMKDDSVLLLQNGQIRDIKTVLLDRESRLRIDPAFREKVIRLQIKKTNIEQGDW